MTVDKILPDKEFGHLYIKTHARAVQYTYRPANDGSPQCGILITAPRCYDLQDVLRSVDQMRPRLRQMLTTFAEERKTSLSGQKDVQHRIGWDFSIQTDCLQISFVRGNRSGVFVHNEAAQLPPGDNTKVLKPAVLQIVCPPDYDFASAGRQEWLENAIVEGIRQHAKAQLIPRMQDYAARYGIRLNQIKITSSKGRWGSCARHTKRTLLTSNQYFNINISLFTLLLPLDVQRLVLLHELTHTRHMDHSAAFHADLDVWLGGQEEELEQKLKRYTTSIFSFT